MKSRLVIGYVRASAFAWVAFSALVACQIPSGDKGEALERRLEKVEQVAQATASATGSVPGLGMVTALAGAVAAVAGAGASAVHGRLKKNGNGS